MISEPTLYMETDTGIAMSSSRDPAKESFIDRHQLWPFYRRRRYCDETMAEIEDTNRLIREHYNPRENDDSLEH